MMEREREKADRGEGKIYERGGRIGREQNKGGDWERIGDIFEDPAYVDRRLLFLFLETVKWNIFSALGFRSGLCAFSVRMCFCVGTKRKKGWVEGLIV
jgi:hypothetical protein